MKRSWWPRGAGDWYGLICLASIFELAFDRLIERAEHHGSTGMMVASHLLWFVAELALAATLAHYFILTRRRP